MTPRPDCKTCGGCGQITVPFLNEDWEYDWETEDCPECAEINELENEQIEP